MDYRCKVGLGKSLVRPLGLASRPSISLFVFSSLEEVPFNTPIENVERIQECYLQHLRMEAAGI